MKKIHSLLCLLLLVVVFAGCDPSESNSSGQNDDTFAQNFGASASKDFIGQVVDTDNHPIQGVSIKIGTSTAQTDNNGVFIINSANVYEKFAYVTATKAGYIDGSRSLVPTSGKNNVKIMLLSNAPTETIQSGVESEVELASGTKVVFDGEFQDEAGNPYTGSVNVTLFHLLPGNENIDKLMPGMLCAQTSTNQQAILETYGMLNVELRGSGGQKLNIREGHTAEITLKIDDSQIATAPNSIPLWHFDEAKGYWKEDGVATKVGNKYVGEVSHFSWWNCDAQFPTVTLTVKIVNANSEPISNVGVGLLVNGYNYPVMGYTNEQGMVSGLIPSNRTLTLNVYPNFYTCNSSNIAYTTSIGPFTTNAILPDITIQNSPVIVTSNVVGSLSKCNGTNVTNGYVMLKKGASVSFSPVTNGAFSFSEIYCPDNTEFTLTGADIENLQTTDLIHYNFTGAITNVGNLQTCNAVDEFISYKIDSNPTVVLLYDLDIGPYSTPNSFFVFGTAGSFPSIYITCYNNIPGTYQLGFDGFWIEAPEIDLSENMVSHIQFNLNQYGAVGEYVDMTFSGTYYDFVGTQHTLSGVVHVKRSL